MTSSAEVFGAVPGLPGAAVEAPGGGLPTSLVLCSESVGEICPRRPLLLVCDQHPERVVPASCDSYRCAICGARKARSKAALLTWACRQPVVWEEKNRPRLVTFTQLPTNEDGTLNFQRARGQIRDTLYRLRQDYPRFEMGWSVEQNPRKTGFHAHGIQHGQYVPQKAIATAWGDRRVDIRALSRPEASQYAIKEATKACGYILKNGREDFTRLQGHLAINGGRAVHLTRGFLHGLTSRDALQAMRSEMEAEPLTWSLVAVDAERYPQLFSERAA